MIYSERLTEKLTKVPGGAVEQVRPKLKQVFNFLILLSFHFFLLPARRLFGGTGGIYVPFFMSIG